MSQIINWRRFAEIVHQHRRFLLTSHVRPDCDALGSELGLAIGLESLGKEVKIVNAHATPPNLAFIDPRRRIKTLGKDIAADQLGDVEALIVLDTSAWQQLGDMGDVVRSTKAKKLLIDHHVSEDDLGAELFKDTTAEATGRLIVDALRQLGVNLTAELALPLFCALATDTGWFRFGSTTGGTYRTAGELVDAGARPQQIWNDLYEQDTLARLKLRGRILARTTAELDGRLVYTWVVEQDFQETGALRSDTEDMINQTLVVKGVEVGVIFVEQPDGSFKVSFRSRSNVQCNVLAERFGGGGHKAAAGATAPGPLASARSAVLDVVRAAMQ